jgi:hypothetical protein
MLHRRLTVEALAQVMGFELPAPDLPDAPTPESWHPLFDATLDNLQIIVPRIDDPLASQWTKGVARVVKYLKELDHLGRAYNDAERDDIAKLVGTQPATVEEGRRALEAAMAEGSVADDDYLRYAWRQVQRDDYLMRTASGALRDRTWPVLT